MSSRRSRRTNKKGNLLLPVEKLVCCLCNKNIDEPYTSFTDKESRNPIHFSCAADELKKSNALETNDRLLYIGSGSFAVIEKGTKKIKIKKRVVFEGSSQWPKWRERMQLLIFEKDRLKGAVDDSLLEKNIRV